MAHFIYEDIKDYLMQIINENKHNTDYKLPSENQLALKFKTTRITAKRALTALTEEGYIYRLHGKGSFVRTNFSKPLPVGEKDFVCLFLPNIKSNFMADIIDGATNYLEGTNIQLIVCSNTESSLISNSLIMKVTDIGTKGIIFFPFDNEGYNKDLMLLALNNFPVVFIDRTLLGLDISAVSSNHFDSAKNAVQMLIDKGSKQIALLCTALESSSTVHERKRGYDQALIDNGRLIKNEHLFAIDAADPHLTETVLEYLTAHPEVDGLITAGDRIGLDVIKAVKKKGINVPRDLQIIFYDDEYSAFCDLLPFSPTCIKQNGFRIGSEAARVVTNLIRTNNSVNEQLKMDCTILERGSTR